jgi:hypothetical protein
MGHKDCKAAKHALSERENVAQMHQALQWIEIRRSSAPLPGLFARRDIAMDRV